MIHDSRSEVRSRFQLNLTSRYAPSNPVILQSFECGLGFWAKAAAATCRAVPRTTRVAQQGGMGYGLQVTAPTEAGRNVAAYLLTCISYGGSTARTSTSQRDTTCMEWRAAPATTPRILTPQPSGH